MGVLREIGMNAKGRTYSKEHMKRHMEAFYFTTQLKHIIGGRVECFDMKEEGVLLRIKELSRGTG